MDVFRCLPLTLLLLHRAACASDRTEVIGAVGRSVTFFFQTLDTATAWTFHNEVIATVKFGNPPEVTFFDNNYKSRLAFTEHGRALTISQLRMDDAGDYTAKTPEAKTTFTLRVYRELVVPTVTCAAQNCSADGCNYTLICAVSGSGYGNISYGWKMGGWLLSEGPTVLVEESPPEELPLTCTVQNPVSSHNATVISPGALCAAVLPMPPENTTHPPTTGTYSSSLAGAVAASVIGAAGILAMIAFFIYCKSKGQSTSCLPAAEAVNTEAGAEYMTVYAQVGPYQQVPQQSLPKEHQEDPKKTPSTDVETSQTVYFTIQAKAQTGSDRPGCQEQDEKTLYSSVGQPESLEQPRQGSETAMNLL